mgnify:CR=1 FL=1
MAKKKAFALRLDPEVLRAVEKWAADELRSINAQIEFLLTQAVKNAGRMRSTNSNDILANQPPNPEEN